MLLAVLFHFIGDFWFQSSWMARNKSNSWFAALAHATAYSIPFFWLFGLSDLSFLGWLLIWGTHLIIDRFPRIITEAIYIKNFIGQPLAIGQKELDPETGFEYDTPPYLSRWLIIIHDNIVHITLNTLIIYYL